MDDAEDVDMDGDDREGEGDEQDDEEMAKGGDENAPIDISMDQDNSQIPLTSPTTEENTLSNPENIGQQRESADGQVTLQSDDAQPSGNGVRDHSAGQDATSAPVPASSSTDAPQDVTMSGTSQTEEPTSQEVAPVPETATSFQSAAAVESEPPSDMPTTQPVPSSAASIDDIKLPDVDAGPSAEAQAMEKPAAPMEVEVEQPLERPEDSTDALALPVASSVPMPIQTNVETPIESPEAPLVEASLADLPSAVEQTPFQTSNPVEPEAIRDVPSLEESPALAGEVPAAEMKRSLTPSPSPERIQEFKEHEAAIEEPIIVPGNLPSPSPQLEPPSITSPPEAPNNAVEGAVAGSHVTDVQLGGGASGAEAGDVVLESTSREPETKIAEEITMEGEADPGKSLGEGDPVGVNGQEEFGDEDVRRTDDVPAALESAATDGDDKIVE